MNLTQNSWESCAEATALYRGVSYYQHVYVCIYATSCRLRMCLSSSVIRNSESSWCLIRFLSLSFRTWFCFLASRRVCRVLSSCSCTHTHIVPFVCASIVPPKASMHVIPFLHLNSAIIKKVYYKTWIAFFPFLLAWSYRSWAQGRRFIPSTVFLFAQHL